MELNYVISEATTEGQGNSKMLGLTAAVGHLV